MNTQAILHHLSAAGAEMRRCAGSTPLCTEISGPGPDSYILSSRDGSPMLNLLTPDRLSHSLNAQQARNLARALLRHARHLDESTEQDGGRS